MEKIKSLLVKYKEIITYVIFGGLTTLLNWGVYTVLISFTPLKDIDADVSISNGVAWVAGVLFAFVTNKIWVFESKSKEASVVAKEFVSFVGARGFTGLIEIFGPRGLMLLGLSQTIFGIKGMVAKVTTSVVVVILNYVFSKLWIFKKKKD